MPRKRKNRTVAVVSTAMTTTSGGTQRVRLSGVSRFQHIENVAGFASQSILVNELVTPRTLSKLWETAKTFQRIRYLKLSFEAITQVPSSIGGGYVLAAIADPSDSIGSSHNPLEVLTSQYGAKTTKLWQSTTATMPVVSDLLFTSVGNDVRLYSPGRVVVAIDGAATQPGSITILCHWSVELYQPGMSVEATDESFVTCTGWVISDGNKFMAYPDQWSGGTSASPWPSRVSMLDVLPGVKRGVWYNLPHPYQYDGGSQAWNYQQATIDLANTTDIGLREHPFEEISWNGFKHKNTLLRPGDQLHLAKVPQLGN